MSLIHKFTKHLTKLAFLGTLAFGSMAFAEEKKDFKDDEIETQDLKVEAYVGFHGDIGYQLADSFDMEIEHGDKGSIQEVTVGDGLFTSELLSGTITFNEDAQFDEIFDAHEFRVDNDGETHKAYNEYNMFLKMGLEAYVDLDFENEDTDTGVSLQAGIGVWMQYHAKGEAGLAVNLVDAEDATYEDCLLSFTLAEFLPEKYSQFDNFVHEGGVYLDFHDETVERKGTAVRFSVKNSGIEVGFTPFLGNFQKIIWDELYMLDFELEGDMDNLELTVPYHYEMNHIKKKGDFVQFVGDYGFDDGFWRMRMEFGGGVEWYDLKHVNYFVDHDYKMDWDEFGVDLFDSYLELGYFTEDYVYDYFENVYEIYGLFMINAEKRIELGKGFMLWPHGGVGIGSFHLGASFQWDKFLVNVNYDNENRAEFDVVLDLSGNPGLVGRMLSDERSERYTFFPLSQSVLNKQKLNYYNGLRGAVVRGHLANHRAEVQFDFGHRDIFFSIMAGIYMDGEIDHNYGAITVGHPKGFLVRTGFTSGRDEIYLSDTSLFSMDLGVKVGKRFTVLTNANVSDFYSSAGLGIEGKF